MRSKDKVLASRRKTLYSYHAETEEKILTHLEDFNHNFGLLIEILVDIRDIMNRGYKISIEPKIDKAKEAKK